MAEAFCRLPSRSSSCSGARLSTTSRAACGETWLGKKRGQKISGCLSPQGPCLRGPMTAPLLLLTQATLPESDRAFPHPCGKERTPSTHSPGWG